MTDCTFCQIVSGKIPCYKVFEDDNILAFLDIYPFGQGHTQIIPKKHYRYVWDMPEPGVLLNLGQKLVQHYRQILRVETAYAFIIGELMPHAHLQIIPKTQSTSANLDKAFADIREPQLTETQAKDFLTKIKAPLNLV